MFQLLSAASPEFLVSGSPAPPTSFLLKNKNTLPQHGRADVRAVVRFWSMKMRLNKKQRERLLRENCGAINNDDAIDPRHYFYNKKKSKSKFRKVFQLCRQVKQTLQMVLTEGNEKLTGLSVVDVVPAPDSRRMLVIVELEPDATATGSDVEALMALLVSETPRLRFEISQSIHRRKTPQLIFEFAQVR